MEMKDYLKEEIKRMYRINENLEKELEKNNNFNISIGEFIKNNTLAMCEIAKVYQTY